MQNELEKKVALTLSPILVAIAAFSLPLMLIGNPNSNPSLNNEIFGAIGIISVTSSAILIDWLFDSLELTFEYRLKMMNYGYTSFAFVIGLISCSIFILYNYQENNIISWRSIFFFITGACTFGKLMSLDKKEHWLLLLIISYVLSVFVTFFPLNIFHTGAAMKYDLQSLSNLSSIITLFITILMASVGLWGYFSYRFQFRKKTKMLENYLKQEKLKNTDEGKRSVFHIVRHVGLTEDEIIQISFKSKNIDRRNITGKDNIAEGLLFVYVGQC